MARLGSLLRGISVVLLLAGVSGCNSEKAGHVEDEAQLAGRDAASFQHASEDYFKGMDSGVELNTREVKGRNMWLVWTGGNDRFWDGMTASTFGAFDLLKIVAPAPTPDHPYDRSNRWEQLGLVNEPCFTKAAGPDPGRFGLYLDVRGQAPSGQAAAGGPCPADPFENPGEYPGVKIGARGTVLHAPGKPDVQFPVGSYYGYPSGIVGLRLFPNPAFDSKAYAYWDARRYYSDPSYYNDAKLVRPYRVGMSCGFCHVGPSPTHPPKDPENPQWTELNSTVGAQYMWVDRLFAFERNPRNFMYQLVHTYRQGSMDTSLVSTDNINNPRTMNAIYNLEDRLKLAKLLAHERLTGGGLNNKQFNSYISEGWLTTLFHAPDKVETPHVLKDGSDSVGALGALNRVYLNIGLFSEEWLLHFRAVVGGAPISPIRISTAERNSAYWRATEAGTPETALFFLKAAQPDRLPAQASGADAAAIDRGKTVFADTCARCHSSKQPDGLKELAAMGSDRCTGPGYLDCFHTYWDRTRTADYKRRMEAIVHAPDFLDHNYLSTELRVPSTLLRTNACSPLATNAIRGNIWDNFSSESYKRLPSVGTITLQDPFTGADRQYRMPAGGRGYTRPPSLVSLWSTAPFLLNNSVGPDSVGAHLYGVGPAQGGGYDHDLIDPSIEARQRVFQASIQQLLWPTTRNRDSMLPAVIRGKIDRTTQQSELRIPAGYIPQDLEPAVGFLGGLFPGLVQPAPASREVYGVDPKAAHEAKKDIVLGPIPGGMPVSILANTQLRAESGKPWTILVHWVRVLKLAWLMNKDLRALPPNPTDEQLHRQFVNARAPLMELSKCPDFVVNRGHLFGTAEFNGPAHLTADERSWGQEAPLSDTDKNALIAFLKTF